MKHTILVILFFATSLSFAQLNGSIHGSVLDLEANNNPLAYAKILIKETGATVLTDEKGLFKFENLKDGVYTLSFSFIGYKTKQSEIKVIDGKSTKVKLHLAASTVSLDDLTLVLASANNNTQPNTSSH